MQLGPTLSRCSAGHCSISTQVHVPGLTPARGSQASTSNRCLCSEPCSPTQHTRSPKSLSRSQKRLARALFQPLTDLRHRHIPKPRLGSLHSSLLGLALWQSLFPFQAGAAESVSLDFLQSWLDQIDALGPLGPIFFVISVAAAEMIPLFPTQPLSLAGGIAFGAAKGSVLVLSANLTAGILSFTLARTVGRALAQRVIQEEVGEDQSKAGVRAAIQRVEDTIEKGSFAQQCTSILLLRLTPIVPFSASNYLLGLTPLQYPPFILGSIGGMAVWAAVYASIGGAGRTLLQSGVSLNDVFAGIQADLGAYTEDAAVFALCAGLVVLAWQGGKQIRAGQLLQGSDEDDPDKVAHAKK